MGYAPPPPPPQRIDITTMGDAEPRYYCWATTGLVADAVLYPPPVTPCAYCGRKAPADVLQCLGCGAPR